MRLYISGNLIISCVVLEITGKFDKPWILYEIFKVEIIVWNGIVVIYDQSVAFWIPNSSSISMTVDYASKSRHLLSNAFAVII